MVVGYSDGYSQVLNLEYNKKQYFTLHRIGQIFIWTCYGDEYSPPLYSLESAKRYLAKTLHNQFYIAQ